LKLTVDDDWFKFYPVTCHTWLSVIPSYQCMDFVVVDKFGWI